MSDEESQASETTLQKDALTDYKPPYKHLRPVGVLVPIAGLAPEKIRIEGVEVIVGRDPTVSAIIPDQRVSRQHARITRSGDDFILEDLGSANGTHVDGVPILSCELHDGDIVQFGESRYYFDRLLETGDDAHGDRS